MTGSHWRNPKSSNVSMICIVMSCVGGEVTVLMEPSGDGRGERGEARKRGNPIPGRSQKLGSVDVSGVWIGARKLGGELDVEQRRIVRLVGESMSRCGTSRVQDSARVWPPCEEEP